MTAPRRDPGESYYKATTADAQGNKRVSHHWARDTFLLTAKLIRLGWLVLDIQEVEPPDETEQE